VNTKTADYAVVTGVQVHNWASDLDDVRVPSMEFVAPARAYVVINGEKIDLDLQQVRCCCLWLVPLTCTCWVLLDVVVECACSSAEELAWPAAQFS
jgi:hypothetical protein